MAIKRITKISSSGNVNGTSCTGDEEFEVLDTSNADDFLSLYFSATASNVGPSYIPKVGGYWGYDSRLIVKSVKPKRGTEKKMVDGSQCYVWKVSVNYGEPDSKDTNEDTKFPTTKISSSTEWTEIAVASDLYDTPNLNSANEWFSDPLIRKLPIRKWQFSQRELTNPESFTNQFLGAINSKPIWGLEPYTVKVDDITVSHDTGEQSFDVVYSLSYNPQRWIEKRCDAGFCVLDDDGYQVRVLKHDGSPIDTPIFLDGSGNRVQSNTPTYYHEFHNYPEMDLNLLWLPNPMT